MRNTLKRKLFSYIVFLLILSIFSSIYALLIFLNKANSQQASFNTITFIMGVISFFILGLLAGNTAQKNGLLEGLIAALIIILITLIINFFIQVPFVARSFVKSVSYITAASLGGILGVNFRPIFVERE
jgi:putative membrane protein (TIGR04086 family)